jgi:hypothetical protein
MFPPELDPKGGERYLPFAVYVSATIMMCLIGGFYSIAGKSVMWWFTY